MCDHFHGLVSATRRAVRLLAVPQDPQVVLPLHPDARPLYRRLLNLSSPALFDEVVAIARAEGPDSPMPSHYDAEIPVPSGAIDKW